MTAATDPLAMLARALDQTGRAINAVRPDQAALPTPCRSWDVATLMDHLVDVLHQFTVRARGGMPDWSAVPAAAGPDWAPRFEARSVELLATWRAAEQQTGAAGAAGHSPVDQELAELAMHAWDLTVATGQRSELDEELAEIALAWAQHALRPEFRGEEANGKVFGPEVAVLPEAGAYQRLAGFFGRDPQAWGEEP